MKLSRTFGIGAALAVLPLVASLAFTVDRLQELASQSERLMLRQLTAVRLGTGVATRLDRLREYQSKFAVSADNAYADKAEQVARAIDGEFKSLASRQGLEYSDEFGRGASEFTALDHADMAPGEDAALAAFIARWQHFRAAPRRDVAEVESLALDARALLTSAHEAAVADVARAAETRAAASRAALTATAMALLSSVVMLLLLTRRLRRRLDDFVEASAAVSRGAFSATLPADSDDELGRIARAFNAMVKALEQLEQLKSDFISSISHELRTPLVAMVETNEALLDDVAGPLTERQRRMITLNRGAAQRLSVMLGDLLELSVVRSGLRYRKAPTSLSSVVVTAAHEFDSRARERGVVMVVDAAVSLTMEADHDRLVQVVQNLVSNALKHTPEGSRVEVRLGVVDALPATAREQPPVAPSTRWALLHVDDSGPGIPEADRERVFQKFFRRQGVSADGVGLGLAICREIVHAHSGAVWIEDSPIGGTRMCVALPLEPAT